MYLLCIQLIVCAIGGIAGIRVGKMLVDRDMYDKFEKRQVITSVVIALIIVIIAVMLESRFPSAEDVITMNIPDEYEHMDVELQEILEGYAEEYLL